MTPVTAPHLQAVGKKSAAKTSFDARDYPFCVPAIAALARVEFAPVTVFVGENGTGKSTLLEAIACGVAAVSVGAHDLEHDDSLHGARLLARHLRFEWRAKTQRGFFLRAEDVFGFVKRVNQNARELEQLAERYERDYEENPAETGARRAAGYVRGQRAQLAQRYGENADAHSHGETFLNLFQERIAPNGVYLLDEPEAALSPQRQLALLSLMKSAVAQSAQFIIATHSPMLMAFPDAQIFSFDSGQIAPVSYDELENVKLLRAFLKNPETFVRRL